MTPRITLYLIVALVLSLALLLIVALRAQAEKTPKQAFAVCEGRCLKAVAISPGSRLEVPLKNGKPDYKQGKLYRTTVVVDHALERIEFH